MTEAERQSLRDQMVERLPNLRAFARTLVNDPTRADDLVQDTIVKALSNLDSFTYGTNLTAWLFTILRNHYYTQFRNLRREVADADGIHAARMVSQPGQLSKLEFRDFQTALARLPDEQREALVLVGGSGFSYEDAAEVCGCAVGTIKSRVNRARVRLTELLDPHVAERAEVKKVADHPCPDGKKVAGIEA